MSEIFTVRGTLSPNELGITCPHEHVFIDLRCWLDPNADKRILRRRVSLEILAELKRKDGQCEDNMKLSSLEDAVKELKRYKKFGGKSVVDVTLPGIGRDVRALREVSKAAAVNVICGTGWYVDSSHPPEVRRMDAKALSEVIVSELDVGIQGTGIRAGVIGELGCSEPLTTNEKKVLSAAGKAQAATNAGVTVHTALFDETRRRIPKQAPEELAILEKNDADLSKVYISHMDFTCNDLCYQEKVLDRYRVTIDYDTFGQDQYYDNIFFGAGGITDKERIDSLTRLLKSGFEKQLMLSQDVCEKIHLRKYGGWGYSHVLEHIVQALRQNGISNKQIRIMIVDNPRRLLAR